MYSWPRIAQRTEAAYTHASGSPHSAALVPRLERLLGCGPLFGIVVVLFAVLDGLWLRCVQQLSPEAGIDCARPASQARAKEA